MSNKHEELILSDATIGHVAQLLQMAILTGTDIIDHLRMAKFTTNDTTGRIELHPDYHEQFQENIQRMMEDANALATQTIDDEDLH
tara:strand:+ start:6232 stop:6489 length:258 start_codon:yes stop_codon:yes gene_type:complete